MTEAIYELTLTEPMLGSKPSNEAVFTDYIAAGKQDGPDPEEVAAAKAAEERVKESMTVFHRLDDGTPMIWNYQVLGFAKDACGGLRRVPDTRSAALKAYKSVIDATLFISPRKIPLILPEGGHVGVMERPLRAETMQGPRVALAKSETVPAGTKLVFKAKFLQPTLKKTFEEWLDYGSLRGLGQWRNASWGTFTWKELPEYKPGKYIGKTEAEALLCEE